jgi:hypothetical protein
VLGPYSEGSIEAIKKAHDGIGEVPKDALLSRGDKYIDTVHEERPWDEQRLLATYELKKPVQFSSGTYTFSVSAWLATRTIPGRPRRPPRATANWSFPSPRRPTIPCLARMPGC